MKFDLDQNNSSNDSDDDIIDLTEVIEKGNPTASTAESTINAALSDLGNSPAIAPDLSAMGDVDLDALLAQMDSDGGFSHLENDVPAPVPQEEFRALGNPSEPDDQDADTPDLSDVDALLAEMDMPPQPESAPSSTPAAAQSAAQAHDDIDAMLDGILDGPTAPGAPATAPPKAPPIESSAATQEPNDTASDDLDALFESILDDAPLAPPASAAPKMQAPPATNTNNMDDLDDMDALLNDVLGEENFSAADVAASLVPGPAKNNDLSFEAVAQAVVTPRATEGTVKPAQDPDFDSLEQDLDAILNDNAPSKTPSLDDELDAILSDNAPSKTPSLDDELDAILNDNAPSKTPSLDDDLDAILGASEQEIFTAAAPEMGMPEMDAFDQSSQDNVRAMAADVVAQAEHAELEELAKLAGQTEQATQVQSHGANEQDDLLDLDALMDTLSAEPQKPAAPSAAQPTPFDAALNDATDIAADVLTAGAAAAATVPVASADVDTQHGARFKNMEERLHMLEENTALRLQDLEKQISLAATGDDSALQDMQANLANQEQKIAALETQSQQSAATEDTSATLQAVQSTLNTHSSGLEHCQKTLQAVAEKMAAYETSLASAQEQLPAQSHTLSDEAQALLQQLQTSFTTQEEKITQLEAQNLALSQDAQDAQDNQKALRALFDEQQAKFAEFEQKTAELEKSFLENPLKDASAASMADEGKTEELKPSIDPALFEAMVEKMQLLEKAAEEASERENSMKEIIAAQVTKLENSVQTAIQSFTEQSSPAKLEQDMAQWQSQMNTTLEQEKAAAKERENILQAKLETLESSKQEQANIIEHLQTSLQSLDQRLQALEEHLHTNLEKMTATAAAKVLREEILVLLNEG